MKTKDWLIFAGIVAGILLVIRQSTSNSATLGTNVGPNNQDMGGADFGMTPGGW